MGVPTESGSAVVVPSAPTAADDVLPEGWVCRRIVLAPHAAGTLRVELCDRDRDGPLEVVAGEESAAVFREHGALLSTPLDGPPERPLVLDVLYRPTWSVEVVSLVGALFGEPGENAVQGLRTYPEEGLVQVELRLSLGGEPLTSLEGGFRVRMPENVGNSRVRTLDRPLALELGERRCALAHVWLDPAWRRVSFAGELPGVEVDGASRPPAELSQAALFLFVSLE